MTATPLRATTLLLAATAAWLAAPVLAAGQTVPAAGLHSGQTAQLSQALAAQPGERVLIERLAGVVFRAEPEAVTGDGVRIAGYDVTAVPLLEQPDFAVVAEAFLGRPASYESIQRMALATRTYLQQLGYPFVAVFVPPQVIDGDTVQVVVQPSRLESIARVEGARHFSAAHYLRALRQEPGRPVHMTTLTDDLAWLNRQPFHQVTVAVEPGAAAGTSALVLRVRERFPVNAAAGYDNTGTATTGENRVFTSITWGNAFGRGDVVSYQFRTDPDERRAMTHTASYATNLPWRHTVALSGAWTRVQATLPAPFTQGGTSWQAGARYDAPLGRSRSGWERQLALAADFKYADNTLEFATIPVVDNVTHVVQAGATLSLSRGNAAWSASLYASPGSVTDRNSDAAFDGSRAGARARYAYGRIDGRYSRALPRRFAWSAFASLQAASGPLLGTEQMSGGGSAGVRGYRESSAFGDDGVLVNTELHLPSIAPLVARSQAVPFVFVDAALLRDRGPGGETTRLAAAGAGFNYRIGRHLSLRGVYGWPLTTAPGMDGRAGHGHLNARVGW